VIDRIIGLGAPGPEANSFKRYYKNRLTFNGTFKPIVHAGAFTEYAYGFTDLD
jgi:hypothetical protein